MRSGAVTTYTLATRLHRHHLDLHRGRARDRAVERSTLAVHLDERFRLLLRHAGQLEGHRDRREAVRFGGRAYTLDDDVHTPQWEPDLFGMPLDQRDAARRHAGEKRLAVRERVGLRPGG